MSRANPPRESRRQRWRQRWKFGLPSPPVDAKPGLWSVRVSCPGYPFTPKCSSKSTKTTTYSARRANDVEEEDEEAEREEDKDEDKDDDEEKDAAL